MQDKTNILLNKLDSFIRKYYKNLLIKGALLAGALLVIIFLVFIISEYFGYFGQTVRMAMFFLFIAGTVFILAKYIFIPIAGFLRIGKHISHQQASRIIGDHFPEVKDHLLNTLQLSEISKTRKSELLIASINQRTDELTPIPFNTAIDFKGNKKYVKYTAIPVGLLLVMVMTAPTSITEPTKRIVKYKEHFERPLPYSIILENQKLEVIKQENFTIKVSASGEEIPKQLYVKTDNSKFRMNSLAKGLYTYQLRNVNKNISFSIANNQYESERYELKVLPRPTILNFEINLEYPDYTKKKDETMKNKGDLIVPEGTEAEWNFFTRDTRSILVRLNDEENTIETENSNRFTLKQQLTKNGSYTIKTSNEYLESRDSLVYSISIVKDQYPEIGVNEYRDSVENRRIYFDGLIKDDYGFTAINILRKNETEEKYRAEAIALSKETSTQKFFHFIDLKLEKLKPGQVLQYYFEVWDNDQVNGFKSARTAKMKYKVPTVAELEKEDKEQRKKLQSDMENTMNEVQKLNKQIDDVREKLINKENLNWEDRKNIMDLLNKQQNLGKQLKELSELNKEKFKKESRFNEQEERILEKQKQLQELFDKVLDEEMKKKIEELQKLIDSLNKDKLQEEMEEMKFNNKELEKRLDRNLELFKQLEFEKKLEDRIKDLEELAKRQKELGKETKERAKPKEDLKNKQDSLNKDFKNLQKDLDELEKMNEELEYPNDFERDKNKEEAIDQEMEKSSEELDQGEMNEAEKSQKNAAQMLQEMQESMAAMQQSMMMNQMGEDMKSLREQLENIIKLSFDQEDLIDELKTTSSHDPKYLEIIDKQNEISDELEKVKDSLYALSKRQVMIEPFINKQISKIERDYDKVLLALQNRRINTARNKQQYVMTSVNNLALFMSEMLNRMQQQMSMMSQGEGNQSCPSPGSGKPSMKSIRQMQQQLNKQMEQMKQGMTKGKSGGGQKMSKQLAKMAAQQEQIRRMMEKYQEEMKEEGQGYGGNMNKALKEMEETETDLVNRMITNETLKRQKEILTRLLKSEKAERQREKEKRRESKEAEEYDITNPPGLKEFQTQKRNEKEMLRSLPPKLNNFYKTKVNQYFYNFNLK